MQGNKLLISTRKQIPLGQWSPSQYVDWNSKKSVNILMKRWAIITYKHGIYELPQILCEFL